MNLPKAISDLVKAQDKFDSAAYTECFSENAIVYDEGRIHQGKTEIQNWITKANEKYQTVVRPIGYEQTETKSILTSNVSGTFEGSPIVLKYHFEIIDGLIQSLKITS